MKKRVLSLLLCLALLASLFPAVYAAGEDGAWDAAADSSETVPADEAPADTGADALDGPSEAGDGAEEPGADDEAPADTGADALDGPSQIGDEAEEPGETDLDDAGADDTSANEPDAAPEESPVCVRFVCDPAETEITVYAPAVPNENGESIVIGPEADGSWLLLPGAYCYDATAAGYLPLEGIPFVISGEPLEQEIPVRLAAAEQPDTPPVEYTLDFVSESGHYAQTAVAGTYMQSNARSMLGMINALRAGDQAWYWNPDNTTKTVYAPGTLAGMSYDYNLERIAMQRAAELAVYYSHTRPIGELCFSLTYNGTQSFAENIGWTYGDGSPGYIFSGFREDDQPYAGQGHRRAMLSNSYSAVGLACFYYNGYYYWAQEFGFSNSGAGATAANDSPATVLVDYDVDHFPDLVPVGTVTLSFDANGGVNAPAALTGMAGKALTLPAGTPTRDGYKFLGWATSAGATAAEYQPGSSITPSADTTLYAVWRYLAPPDPSDPVTLFVKRAYNLILSREPDAQGLSDWFYALKDGVVAGGTLVNGFILSPEFLGRGLSNEDVVTILYAVMLDRVPDADGLALWVGFLNDGLSNSFIVSGFVGSPEFRGICASYGIDPGAITLGESRDRNPKVTAFVSRNYRLILERVPDADGLNAWTSALLSGTQTGAAVVNGFVLSPEFLGRGLSSEKVVEILYSVMLNRVPDADGRAVWVDFLNQGHSYTDIVNGFAGSGEFHAICADSGITAGWA